MIEQLFGMDSDLIIIALAIVALISLILLFVVLFRVKALEANYAIFMEGKNAKSLEEVLTIRLNQVDELIEANAVNEAKADRVTKMMANTFQKYGLVKYNAFDEAGGKMSFSLALLNEKNDGFVMNAVHSQEGCYTYIKEVVSGSTVSTLAKEEKEALELAKKGQK